MRRTLLLMVLAALPCAARGQVGVPAGEAEDRYRGIHVAATAGPNHVTIRNPFDAPDPQLDGAMRLAPSAGVLAGFHFDDVFAIRTGVLYTRLGRSGDGSFRFDGTTQTDIEKTVALDYVQIPLLLRAAFRGSLDTFYIQAGLVYGRLLSATVERNGEAQETDARFRDDEVGVLVEVGPSRRLSDRLYLTLGLRGYAGVTDLNDPDLETTGLIVGKSQNTAVGVHLTVHYFLGRD